MKTLQWMSKSYWSLMVCVGLFLAPQLFAQTSIPSGKSDKTFSTAIDTDTNFAFLNVPYETATKLNYGSIYLGENAGKVNHLGFDNTFIGENAGKNNQSGYDNTFLGKGAGSANNFGNANTFIGKYAGNANISGYYNTFLGRDAGAYNLTGNNNTFIGRNSGGFHRIGDSNTFLGAEAGMMNETGKGNVFIGFKAGYHANGDNLLFIDNTDTNTPLIWGDFQKKRVGINRIARTNTLEINGTASKTTPGNWSGIADRRLMDQVQQVNSEEMLEKVLELSAISYDLQPEDHNTSVIGFDGAELKKVRPDLVKTNAEGYLEATYGDMDPMLVEAIKALNNKIESLEKENLELKNQLRIVDELKAEMQAIRQVLNADNR